MMKLLAASARDEGAFCRHDSGVQRCKRSSGGFEAPGAGAFGAPSAWLFLVRVHACRAGLRFTRHHNVSSPFLAVNYCVNHVSRKLVRCSDWQKLLLAKESYP
jgi:hypothetical protein